MNQPGADSARIFKGLKVVRKPPAGAALGRMFIDGQWEIGTGTEWLGIVSPATGETLGWLPLGSRADARRAIAAARAGAPGLAGLSVWQRAALCGAIADRIIRRGEEIAQHLTREQGKPIREARAEVAGAASGFRNSGEQIKWLESSSFPVEDPGKRAFSILQPKGVFGIITPWNFPVSLPAIYFLGPAVATGNAMVWVPAPTTSLIAALLVDCMLEAGMPPGAVNLVTGEGPVVGDALVTSPDLQGIAFTGSSEVGRRIAARAADKAQLLELGGNGPSVVLADADLDHAAACIVKGALANAGQICTATERVLVAASVHDALVARIVALVQAVRPGPPLDDATVLGPINNEDNAAKVDLHLAEARAGGARMLTGGGRVPGMPTPLYYEPTVITDVPPDCALHRDETFGPVIPILPFADETELFALVAKSRMGLSGAVFTQDIDAAFAVATRLPCGIVNVNESSSYWETHIPAGGAAGTTSGLGRIGGRHTLIEMSDLKTLTFHIKRTGNA